MGAADDTLVRALAAAEPFSRLAKRDLRLIASEVQTMRLQRGQTVVRQGDEGDDLYLVLRGTLDVFVEDAGEEQHLSELGPGSVIGEIAFLAGGRRAATVRATTRTDIARLSSSGFSELLSRSPRIAAELARAGHRRLLVKHLATDLPKIFGPISEEVRSDIEQLLEWVHLPAGDVLYRKEDVADAAFFVVFGRLRIVEAGDDEVASEAERGDVVGARALIEGGCRDESVFAARDSYLVRLPRAALDSLVERHPHVTLGLARSVLRQVSGSRPRRAAAEHLSVAVVAASRQFDLHPFVSELTRALSTLGSAFHAWSARVDTLLRRPGICQSELDDPADMRVTRWLHELETEHQFVVYETDRTWSAWTRRAVRQGDRILIVADADDDSALGAVEKHLIGTRQRRAHIILVLVHAEGTRLCANTTRWLSERTVDEVVHVRRGSAADMERLARVASHRAVGLVLSGGGARGFAHLGVLRALHELQIPVDVVGGSSIGAVIAALVAMEIPIQEMISVVRQRFSRLLDYTLPMVALVKGKRMTKSAYAYFGDHYIEDLWRSYFCMSTNLTRYQSMVHRRGPLVPALRASVAVPGVLPPVPIEGELHIDGGVMNNLPIDVMRRLYPHATIIAVDVAPPVGRRAKEDFGLWVSGARALKDRILRRRRGLPRLTETLVSATIAASMQERDAAVAQQLADLYVPLDIRGVGLLEFRDVEKIAAKGYDTAMPQIEAWLATRP